MSTPWIVHQYPPSPYCERLRRVLVRLELPFEVQDYMPISEEARAAVRDLATRANHNQMPVLERDGELLGDSYQIIDRLLQEYPDRAERIYPGDPAKRAVVDAFVLSSEAWWIRPEGQHGTKEYRANKGDEFVEGILANDRARRDAVLHDLDAALATQDFLTGDEYTMADIALVSTFNTRINIAIFAKQAEENGMQIPFETALWPLWDVDGERFPNLRRWFDRCNSPEFTESAVLTG